MPSDATPVALLAELRTLGRADCIAGLRLLSGGAISDTWLVSYDDGTSVVGKTLKDAPPDLFRIESDGLATLRAHLATPEVLAVTDRLLLLPAMPERPATDRAWQDFAHDLAAMHRGTVTDRFGWPRDGWLGRLPQINTWTPNGHDFFAQHRLLRYLAEPLAEQVLTPADRQAVERLCARLPELIPPMPAVLTHGDLWDGNLVGTPAGGIAVIDPAVSFTWPEVDLSMLRCEPYPPAAESFFAAYQELNPSPPGWQDRMPILHLRELLATIAHFGPAATQTVTRTRTILAPFA